MSDVARTFTRNILGRQLLTGLGGFFAIALLAPNLIVLDWSMTKNVLVIGAALAVVAFGLCLLVTLLRVRKHRALLRVLSGGTATVRAQDFGDLASLPSAITMRTFVVGAVVSIIGLAPGVRPDKLDQGRAISLLCLTITIVGAASLIQYVFIRAATVRLLELVPIEPITTLLESQELHQIPRRRLLQKFLIAVVAPVALVGVGAVLTTHAHMRTLTEQSRKNTALLLAKIALDPGPVQGNKNAREDAVAAAAEHGFLARITGPRRDGDPTFRREVDGELVLSVPLEEGQADVRFTAELNPAVTTEGVAIALAFVLLAALLGVLIGRALADDLKLATHRVRLLGTESVLRGVTQIARPARFELVARLGRAIEVLAERFRIFAGAQERALEAQEAAQRMRGLLFASVSHDLKSPLNAILGFADLVGREELTVSQRESLALIANRGRELLGLIESILDTARVEAGQLTLMPRVTEVALLATEAVRKARELAGDTQSDVVLEVAEGLPTIPVDPAYAARAIAVVVAHAIRTSAADTASRAVRVRALRPAEPGQAVRIDVELGSRNTTRAELEALFARRATSRGRGLTLGLSLAQSIMELHGGSVRVEDTPDGAPVIQCWLPLVIPGSRPRLSSKPALG
ncbi:HAMP domain-containing sensor histidine kinase [Polyangium sp. y55x31]|uniref:sensor histidine kinase n=1 Tax=Polyangium sp. y55x31 TaxID=3042688 RepID=UPI002482DBB0|nr:HAMP domain-containing sensor histidine kinase [Polyangium sp. y55x31]MDI1481947.1 HAMP domain-containing sensor histidine kinase [Polyangium sp. y55x31]